MNILSEKPYVRLRYLILTNKINTIWSYNMSTVETDVVPAKGAKNLAKKEGFVTEDNVNRRQALRLENIVDNLGEKREALDGPVIWFDSSKLKTQLPSDDIYTRIVHQSYTGLIVYLNDALDKFIKTTPERMNIILKLKDESQLKSFKKSEHSKLFLDNKNGRFIVGYNNSDKLEELKKEGYKTCYDSYVDDNESLHSAVNDGLRFDYSTILFKDPTNIPLELVIASLQKTKTILLKEIASPSDIDDAIVCLGVMEYGSEGVIFSPTEHEVLDTFIAKLHDLEHAPLELQVGTIINSEPVGMGYRACIDTATLFDDDEGMIVGSTSQGGFLCCPEVFFLPYMELRPFRVNAGAVHSYVSNVNDKTDYMSELKSGSNVMLVNSKGRVRTAPVGRMKIEQRPLRLIEAEFPNGEMINVLMQDDWHVRIFSDKAKPLNISELKPGDKVLGYVTDTGRHVGIKIDENIIEK